MDERFRKGELGGTERSEVPPSSPWAAPGAPQAAASDPTSAPGGAHRADLGPQAPGLDEPGGGLPPEGDSASGAPGSTAGDSWPGDYACEGTPPAPRASRRSFVRRTYKKPEWEPTRHTPQERILLLDTWRRSGLPAGDFCALVGLSKHTLYSWKKRFDAKGPAGLLDQPLGGPRGSRLPELTRRTILMIKESNPDFGCQRISDLLLRGPALPASPGAVARVLHEEGYEVSEEPTHRHPDKPREFERARPNQLWQTDIFTFVLKRQNRRVYLVALMDDHSRFVVGYGLGACPSAAWVIDVFRSAVASYQQPEEVLSDRGPQYMSWRGKSAFTRELESRGIQHIVARPRHPATLGKVERMWGSLWRECVEKAVFLDLLDAQRRIGLYFDYHNFQRPNQGIDGLVPADRFFQAAPEVLRTLKERAAANSLVLARDGLPRTPFYLTGSAGGQLFSVHAEGERVILRRGEGEREEIELTKPGAPEPQAPQSAEPTLPEPICPTSKLASEDLPVPEPGVSAVDALVPPGGTDSPMGYDPEFPGWVSPEEGDDDARVTL